MFILSWNFPLDFHNPVKKLFQKYFYKQAKMSYKSKDFLYQLKGQRIDSRKLIRRWSPGGAGCGITQKAPSCSLLCWRHLEILHWFWTSVPETPFSHDGTNGFQVLGDGRDTENSKRRKGNCWARMWNRHVFMQFVWVIHQNNSVPGELHKSAPLGRCELGALGS